MTSFIYALGLNFKTAELERVAQIQWPDADGISRFLGEIRERYEIAEAFFLQTCNRREFYFYAPDLNLEVDDFRERFLQCLETSLGTELSREHFYFYRDEDAALHLFRVASSLDSMVLGETEIMKQIKDQTQRGHKHGHVGRRLRALFETALWSARQVRTKTCITKNVVSMASLIYRKVSERPVRTLAIVGAGHFVRSVLPTFAKNATLELVLVNRTLPTDLAAQYGGQAMTLSAFIEEPPAFDALLCATGAPTALFTKDWLEARRKPLLVLDAALPRDVEAGAEELDHVSYMDLGAMEAILAENRAAREAEIPKTEPLFAEGMRRLRTAWLECELAGYSRQISDHYQEAGEKALNHLIREHLPDLPHDQAEIIRDWTQALVGKLTNIPILGLKGVARDIGDDAVDAFRRQVAEKSTLFRETSAT